MINSDKNDLIEGILDGVYHNISSVLSDLKNGGNTLAEAEYTIDILYKVIADIKWLRNK